jgi:hypothetical protein
VSRWEALRDLDQRLVPRLAERLARLADGMAARREQARRLQPAGVRSLRDLDDRYTRRGPLALLREVPQLGFVVIAGVFLAGTGTAVSREAANNRRADQQTVLAPVTAPTELPGEEAGSSTLGPEVGATVPAYLTHAAQGLAAAARSAPTTSRTALVSFTGYETPAQVEAMLSGYQAVRLYLRARAGGKDAAQLPVDVRGGALAATLTKAYAQAAAGRVAAQKAYQGYVDSLEVVTKEDQAFKDLYAAFARSTGVEAREYGRGCACVYAAVVTATPTRLLQLRSRSGVRGLEVAGKGLALPDLQLLPLLPEVTGVVPQQQAAADPP